MEKLISYFKNLKKVEKKVEKVSEFCLFLSLVFILSGPVIVFYKDLASIVIFGLLSLFGLSATIAMIYKFKATKYKSFLSEEFEKIFKGENNSFNINLLEIIHPIEKIFYLKKESFNLKNNNIKKNIEYIQEKLRTINLSKEEKDDFIELGLEKPTKVSVEEFYHILNNYDESLITSYLDKKKVLKNLDKIKLLPSVINKEYNAFSYLSRLLDGDNREKEIENILLKDSGEKIINFGDIKISEKALIEVLGTSASLSFILERINLLEFPKYASHFLNKDRIKSLVSSKQIDYLLSLKNQPLNVEQYSCLKNSLSHLDYSLFKKNNPIYLHFNDIETFVQYWNGDVLELDAKKQSLLHDIINYDIKEYHSMMKNAIKNAEIQLNLLDCKYLILEKINCVLRGQDTVKYMSANK